MERDELREERWLGCSHGFAEVEAKKFIEQFNLPFLATPMGKGTLDDRHPLSVGACRRQPGPRHGPDLREQPRPAGELQHRKILPGERHQQRIFMVAPTYGDGTVQHRRVPAAGGADRAFTATAVNNVDAALAWQHGFGEEPTTTSRWSAA